MEKVAIVMRAISGGGKSTKVRQLLKELGGTVQDNVFSTDTFYTPVTNELKVANVLSDEAGWQLVEKLKAMWFGVKWSDAKEAYTDQFMPFKSLTEQGMLKEALDMAVELSDVFDQVEYRGNWDGAKLGIAHKTNLERFQAAVEQGVSPVIVDNTNVDMRSCTPYVQFAYDAGYKVRIEEPNSPHWMAYRHLLSDKHRNSAALDQFAKVLTEKNKHGVPFDAIKRMINNWHHDLSVNDILKKRHES